MPKGFTYILQCSDSSYYTVSSVNLELRSKKHEAGEGANHTRKRLPVKLLYWEEYDRIDRAFVREKKIQGWTRQKKEALMNGEMEVLQALSFCKNDKNSNLLGN